jgi:hypothetical protein
VDAGVQQRNAGYSLGESTYNFEGYASAHRVTGNGERTFNDRGNVPGHHFNRRKHGKGEYSHVDRCV